MKKILYIDIDGVLANIAKQIDTFKNIFPTQPYPQSQYGFFMDMEPIDDAIDSVIKLTEFYDVWFLSAPSYKNPLCLAEKNYWIRKYFGIEMTEKLILSSNKGLCYGDYLIDDNAFGRGQDKFVGELIHFGSSKFPDWKTVISYLIKPISKNQIGANYVNHLNDNEIVFEFGVDKWSEDKNGRITNVYNKLD